MNKTPKELTDSLEKSHSGNEGKKRLTQMVALVAFGASVGLTAEVVAAPSAETRKVSTKVDAKDLKVNKNVDARKVKKVDTRKIEVNTQMDPDSGPKRPPPP